MMITIGQLERLAGLGADHEARFAFWIQFKNDNNPIGAGVARLNEMAAARHSAEPPGPVRFVVGKTYRTRSICDHDSIYEFRVIARTNKTVTIESRTWGEKRRGVRLRDSHYPPGKMVETCMPLGSYSMAPSISADREDA